MKSPAPSMARSDWNQLCTLLVVLTALTTLVMVAGALVGLDLAVTDVWIAMMVLVLAVHLVRRSRRASRDALENSPGLDLDPGTTAQERRP